MCYEPENKGRVVVDCGFTKLWPTYWAQTAGTERYVRNAAVWLLALDYRMRIGAPLKGPLTQNESNDTNNNNTNSTTSSSSKQK